jgi:cell division protein FtsI (penicillin-binding protein 3)
MGMFAKIGLHKVSSRALFDPMMGRIPEKLSGQDIQRFSLIQNRLIVLMMAVITLYSFLSVRLAYIAFVPHHSEQSLVSTGVGERLEIVDRNGEVLATQVPMANLIVNPSKVLDPVDAASRLVQVFPDMDSKTLYEKLSSEKTYTVLRRDLSPKEQQMVHDLGLPAFDFEYTQKRFYPEGNLFAHVLGYVTPDNNGQAGVELSLNSFLTTPAVPDSDGVIRKKPIVLSLDKRVQYVVHDILEKGQSHFKADGIASLIMDAKTGEIVSMVSLPDFDPNYRGGWTYDTNDKKEGAKELDDRHTNRVTLGTYEMGSTFKIFNTAIALETGAIKLTDQFDVTGPLYYRGHAIKDFHPHRGSLSVSDIFRKSSNIGSVRMADRFGVDVQQQYMRRFGMLHKPALELNEVSGPQIPRQWGYVEMMTIAYGYGISVSPLQLITGVASVINGGVFMSPTLVMKTPSQRKEEQTRSLESSALPVLTPNPVGEVGGADKKKANTNTMKLDRSLIPSGTRILSQKTSDQMRYLMRLVVEKGGTGTKADVEGYPVIGKTGTANKAKEGHKGYDGSSCIASFVGAFPYQDPQYAILVTVDTPKLEGFVEKCPTGGLVAAPLAGQVIERIAPLLNVKAITSNKGDFTTPTHSKKINDAAMIDDNKALAEEDSER